MDTVELLSVLDTNAYLGISRGRLVAIANQEADAGVLGLASVWPCLELLSRCTDSDPRTCRRAHSAIQKVLIHAGGGPASGGTLRIHEAGEFTLARNLFQITPVDPILEIRSVGDLVVAAAHTPLEVLVQKRPGELNAIRERVRLEEQRFSDMWLAGIAGRARSHAVTSAPSTMDLALIAAGLVQVLAEQCNVPLDADNSRRGVNLVLHNYPVALAFVHGLIADSPGAKNLPGRQNSAWDLKLAFHASRGSTAFRAPVVLISDDGRLHRAARDAQQAARVLRLAEYLTLLASPLAVKEHAAALRS